MSEIDDAKDFAEAASNYKKPLDSGGDKVSPTLEKAPDTVDGNRIEPGQKTQYSYYRDGFSATTPTIGKLPAGCYDINVDQNAIFAVPTLPPSGLLLELPEMRSEEVIKVVENFWDSEKDYKEGNQFVIGGAAYKAGLMIYGPPGSGKSCTIKLVSKKLFERGGTVFYGSCSPAYICAFLNDFSKIESDRKSIVILEDLDSLIHQYGEAKYLEMLDSAKTINNVLFIATTNYPDRLDPRIYNRPGRFSHVIKIGLPKPATRAAYLKAILKNHRDVDYIVENTSGFTIDHLSALVNAVYREKKVLQNEILRLRSLFNVPKADEKSLGFGFGVEDEK